VGATNQVALLINPANGIVKQLKVDYTFDGKEKSKTVNDGKTLKIDG
jgi:hypothetical protein